MEMEFYMKHEMFTTEGISITNGKINVSILLNFHIRSFYFTSLNLLRNMAEEAIIFYSVDSYIGCIGFLPNNRQTGAAGNVIEYGETKGNKNISDVPDTRRGDVTRKQN